MFIFLLILILVKDFKLNYWQRVLTHSSSERENRRAHCRHSLKETVKLKLQGWLKQKAKRAAPNLFLGEQGSSSAAVAAPTTTYIV
uniref:Uncharacterized protein n=1 Tax=Salix viminalis TaxID=40686 RepID=A0A6N2MZ85_SALVM